MKKITMLIIICLSCILIQGCDESSSDTENQEVEVTHEWEGSPGDYFDEIFILSGDLAFHYNLIDYGRVYHLNQLTVTFDLSLLEEEFWDGYNWIPGIYDLEGVRFDLFENFDTDPIDHEKQTITFYINDGYTWDDVAFDIYRVLTAHIHHWN